MVGQELEDALERVETLRAEALHEINEAQTTQDLETARVRHTGKRSALTQVMQVMGKLEPEGRKRLGADVNAAKADIDSELERRGQELQAAELQQQLETERVDVTLPGTPIPHGYVNPMLQAVRDILGILREMGFSVYEGYEVEWDRYNFEMLNIPADHPARDIQDTFYVNDEIVLRTQTSPAQIRLMHMHKPPVRFAVPGWCYRNEAEDPSHTDYFYQIEGLVVDTDISLGDLKGTLTEVAHQYFGADRRVRFRPSYFPFTEPSAEIDIECGICRGDGCRSCGGEGWLELGGSGVVHPRVLEYGGYDPEEVSGFAFGIGPMRYASQRYGIDDIRRFREGDLRFLRQFS